MRRESAHAHPILGYLIADLFRSEPPADSFQLPFFRKNHHTKVVYRDELEQHITTAARSSLGLSSVLSVMHVRPHQSLVRTESRCLTMRLPAMIRTLNPHERFLLFPRGKTNETFLRQSHRLRCSCLHTSCCACTNPIPNSVRGLRAHYRPVQSQLRQLSSRLGCCCL